MALPLMAAEEVGGAVAARGGAAAASRGAGAAKGAKTPKGAPAARPRDPGARVRELRGQGHDDAVIRDKLTAEGYPAATAQNAAPGRAKTRKTPDPQPAPVEDAEPSTGTGPRPDLATTETSSSSTAEGSGPSLPTFSAPSVSIPGNVSGFVLGLLGAAVLINFMRGGPQQVKAWASAKFLNQVIAAADPATGGPGDDEKRQHRAIVGGGAPVPGRTT